MLRIDEAGRVADFREPSDGRGVTDAGNRLEDAEQLGAGKGALADGPVAATNVVCSFDSGTLGALLIGDEIGEQVADARADGDGQAVRVDSGDFGNLAVEQVADDAFTLG